MRTDDLVTGVPVDGGAAVHLLEQLAGHAGADAFGRAVWGPGAVSAEPGPADEVGEQGERGPGLRGGAVAALLDLRADADRGIIPACVTLNRMTGRDRNPCEDAGKRNQFRAPR